MKQLKLEAFLEYSFLSGLSISPDSEKAAVVVSKANADPEVNGYDSAIWVYKGENWTQLTGLQKEKSFVWEDETHLLFPAARTDKEKERAKGGEEFTSYYRISIDGGEAVKAFELPFNASLDKKIPGTDLWLLDGMTSPDCPDFYSLPKEDQEKALKARKENEDYEILTEIPFYGNGRGFTDKKRNTIFLYDMKTQEVTRVSDPAYSTGSAVTDGKHIYYIENVSGDVVYEGKSVIRSYSLKSGKNKKVLTADGYQVYFLFMLSGKLMACAEKESRWHISDNPAFYEVDFEKEELRLFAEGEYEPFNSTGSDCRLGGLREYKATENAFYFISTVRNDSIIVRLDQEGQYKKIITQPGSVDGFDIAPDGRMLLVGMYDMKLQEVYYSDIVGGKPDKTSSFNDAVLADVYVAKPRKLTIQSQGEDIDGWILYPKDFDPLQKYPAILDIHGGPRTVYGEIFYHEMQVWANMGYFVFFCNPIGGSGRGLTFADITDRYGTIDYQNIMDFTDKILDAYPNIDPTRVGCTGGSYGGFMSNWILGHTDRFACVATQRSISNWVSFYGVSDIGYFCVKNQLAHDIYSDEGLEALWRQSPLKYINEMKTPTLFIHSDQDYRCPMEQGLQLFTALKEKGVPARFVYFKGENHELSRSGKPLHRKKRLQEITDWMEKYCRTTEKTTTKKHKEAKK